MNSQRELFQKAWELIARFDGPCYDPPQDRERLTGQIQRIFNLMRDSRWRTLSEIQAITGDHEASVSAQLRHLKKDRFGGHTLSKRRRGEGRRGLWEYQIIENVRTQNP